MLFQNREHLLYYMLQGHVHLSKKDYGFFNNLQYIIKNSNKVTTNQNKLYDKLVVKYQRQLKKLQHDIVELQKLEWTIPVVETSKEYLEAYVYLEDGSVHIRSPFNTQFVHSFRSVPDNTFIWNKEKKVYISHYDTNALKIAVQMVETYFPDVRYCENITKILDEVSTYKDTIWDPTYKRVSGNYMITSTNKYLDAILADIEFNDDPLTLLELSKHGVIIDYDVTNEDPYKIFAGSYFVTIDLSMLDTLVEYLKSLNVRHVFTSREVIYNKQISNEIKLKLLEHGISCSPVGSTDHENAVLFKTTTNTNMAINTRRIDKIIQLTNSLPVIVK